MIFWRLILRRIFFVGGGAVAGLLSSGRSSGWEFSNRARRRLLHGTVGG